MKTVTANQETISLDKIEKNTSQILKKMDNVPMFFKKKIKFSKKAEEEKTFFYNSLFSKKIFALESAVGLFTTILQDPNFSKLEKQDQDFIAGLDKINFKDSQYVKEINEFAAMEKNPDNMFLNLMEENLYFSLLTSELSGISSKLHKISLNP